MVSLEVLALVLTGLGLTASIVYYANILLNANKTQKLQLETIHAHKARASKIKTVKYDV